MDNSIKGKVTGGRQRLCIHVTAYINNCPCSGCTGELTTFLNKSKQVYMYVRFFVTNLSNIRRRSCRSRQGDHIKKVEESDHKANSWGLWNLLLHGRCEIKAFTKDIWKKLLDLATVSKKCKKQLLVDYNNRMKDNDRSAKDEHEYIQKDLNHITTNDMVFQHFCFRLLQKNYAKKVILNLTLVRICKKRKKGCNLY